MRRQSQVYVRWLVLLACLVLGGIPSAAQAEAKRVAVLDFKGPSAAPTRKDIVKTLSARSDVKVIGAKQVNTAAKKAGVSLKNESGLVKVAEKLHISAFVLGEIDKGKKGFRVKLTVLNGRDGSQLAEQSWTRKKPQLKKMGAPTASMLSDAIANSEAPAKKEKAPPPVAEPEDLSDSPDDDDADEDEEPVAAKKPAEKPRRTYEPPPDESEERTDEPEDAPRAKGDKSALHANSALALWFGPRLMWRNLSYDGDTTLALYENAAGSAAFNLALGAQWYPGAHARAGFLSNIGVEADVDYSLGLKSRQNGREVSTTAYELGIGAIGRIPLATVAELRLRGGFVRHVFDADVPNTVQLPGVSYNMLRVGLGAAMFLGDVVTLDAGFAYLPGLGSGELESAAFAPGASVSAYEVGAGLLVAIKEVYGLRLAVDYRSYKQDFADATSTAIMLPKTGSDTYLRTTLAFVYRMPGMTNGKK